MIRGEDSRIARVQRRLRPFLPPGARRPTGESSCRSTFDRAIFQASDRRAARHATPAEVPLADLTFMRGPAWGHVFNVALSMAQIPQVENSGARDNSTCRDKQEWLRPLRLLFPPRHRESTMATRTSTPRAWAMRLSVSIVGFACGSDSSRESLARSIPLSRCTSVRLRPRS